MNEILNDGLKMIRFTPTAADILERRAEYRAMLIDAVRRDEPVLAAPVPGGWTRPDQREDRHDALCELLACASFLILDTDTALFIGIPQYGDRLAGDSVLSALEDPDTETILRALWRRFQLESVVLTDAHAAFDGEKITSLSE